MENRIAELRKENGLTLKRLSEILDIRDNTLSQYETGKRSPQLGLLQEIANFFNVSIEYLTKYSDKRDYKIDNDEDALYLIEKLDNEKDFNYMNLSNATALNLCMWIIDNENLINFEYPQYINTTRFFIENVVSENKILSHYSKHRIERQKTVDKIDDLLLEEEYYGANEKEVYKFMKESERIGHKKTEELLSYMETLPDLPDEEEEL
ncbi:helix-turn-helix domain-containing protein [Staphylococcus equorum]|uniref:helix-turn-helix domain-containing protein n=1 Tax=Staphylococcus equorum TaxID=246432 RepID=UPI002DB609AF|nr:helix-turn-helix transcriptional regulator [Staphylococcus equorum]MEB7721824.1 helix-turn-helix transcriptional regulator [Staphylococcus equorum]